MPDTPEWPAFDAGDSDIQQLIKLSQYYGSDPSFVLAGGGNTSMKTADRLWVKGSGHALATIGPEGFVEMDRQALRDLVGRELPTDVDAREAAFKQAILAARVDPASTQRPSVEVVLHNLIDGRFVVHSHATLANMITCCAGGETLCGELLGDDVLWIPWTDPGFMLAQRLAAELKAFADRTGGKSPRAILLQSHGLIVAGETPDEVKQRTDAIIDALRPRVESDQGEPYGPVSPLPADRARALIDTIGPALRGLLAESDDRLKIVTFDDSDVVTDYVAGADGKATAMGGPLCPDQIVYCKSFPLWFDAGEMTDPAELVESLREAITVYEQAHGSPPWVVLVAGVGLFASGDDHKGACSARDLYVDAIKVMAGARRLGGVQYMGERDREFIEHWEVEAYRRKIAAAARTGGRAEGKVAMVTGAAQGFGLEIAQDLAAQGAHVVLADINVEGAAAAADELSAARGAGRAIGVAVNVTDGESVADAMHQTVRTYGGLDLLVSNAGVLRAESVKTQSAKDFDFVAAVNYKGYFLAVQKISPILATQHAARPGYTSDIIQINSKSGLTGSNRNAAYAGSKFGGIGLTQSFALELIADGIKVNSICPGNFFDGPLWSDPENGLFVQYLRTGKVPGAKTLADVRRAYEAKVPMGRGCTTADVMKAVYYLMDQQYETGQAVPVTGGQVMLR